MQVFGDGLVYHVDQLLKIEGENTSRAEQIEKEKLSDCQQKDDEDTISESGDTRDSCRGRSDCPHKSDGALQEEMLYQALLRRKTDEDLQKKLRSLLDSCSSVTAQESMLLSLR